MPPILFRPWRAPAVLLALLLAGCGRTEQTLQPTSLAPLAPAPASTTATSAAQAQTATPPPSARLTPPVPNSTAAYLRTRIAFNRNSADATITAEAAWAQTPEPTILPAPGYAVLRDIWPAGPQQASAPTRLYLRGRGGHLNPDTFWEVHLPDAQLRRLPTVEQDSVDDAALLSPDGRFLAYVTGEPVRTLRLLDLASDADLGIDVAVINGVNRCRRQIAWSPDGHTLAALAFLPHGNDWVDQLVLFDPRTGPTPQPLLQLPGSLELLGWLDAERLLLVHWSRKVVEPARLLVVDRQGNQTLLHQLEPGIPHCSSLSPDGRDLIYDHDYRTRHLQLATGQEHPFSADPDTFFWVGDGRTLLLSPFNRDRTVWLRPLDHPEQERNLFLSPPYQSDYHFGITGVSPDGRLLVACEQPSGDNPRIRSSKARTWLYDIAQDRWTLIRDSATRSCDLVLGWSANGGDK